MEYYSKVPFTLKPIQKSKYLNGRTRYQEYLKSTTNTRIQSEPKTKKVKTQDLNISLSPLLNTSIDPLPTLSKTIKKHSMRKNYPVFNETQKQSLQTVRKLYSPLDPRQQVYHKTMKKNDGVQKLQQFLKEFHEKSKNLLNQLEADFKKNCLNE